MDLSPHTDYLSAFVVAYKSTEEDEISSLKSSEASKVDKTTGGTSRKGKKRSVSRRSGSLDARCLGPNEHHQKVMTDRERQLLRHTKTFRRIEADIKERTRRSKQNREIEAKTKKPNAETYYVDKSREMAVNRGVDLKRHILRHQGEIIRSKIAAQSNVLTVNVLLEQAEYEIRHGDPGRALSYLQRGLTIRPDRTDMLVLKCKCLVGLKRFNEALEGVDVILAVNVRLSATSSIDQQNATALTVKGDALYNLGHFEHALLNFQRATKQVSTKGKQGLTAKSKRTELAILNSLGPTAASYFNQLGDLLRLMPLSVAGLPRPSWFKLKNVVDDLAENSRVAKVKDDKFLCEFAFDKTYLDNILFRLSLRKCNTNTEHYEAIKKEAEEALAFLEDRKGFWAQQRPDYPNVVAGLRGSAWEDVLRKITYDNRAEEEEAENQFGPRYHYL